MEMLTQGARNKCYFCGGYMHSFKDSYLGYQKWVMDKEKEENRRLDSDDEA